VEADEEKAYEGKKSIIITQSEGEKEINHKISLEATCQLRLVLTSIQHNNISLSVASIYEERALSYPPSKEKGPFTVLLVR